MRSSKVLNGSDLRILFVDDDSVQRHAITKILISDRYSIDTCENVNEATNFLRKEKYDVVFTEMKLRDLNGIELLKFVKIKFPELPVIIITGYPTIESAVQTIKEGATDYIEKPLSKDKIIKSLETVIVDKIELEKKKNLERLVNQKYPKGQFVGISSSMLEVYRLIQKAAITSANILIQGETGTGKELVARAIHNASNRSTKRCDTVNCGAIPENLLESEYFGYQKGAFTGASTDKIGLIEAANSGTLFLDEIGDLSLALQAKLLRVLEAGELRRLGDTKDRAIDIRIIAASNRNLKDMVKDRKFRKDLYYRLDVIRIYLPPLRSRKEDIPLLLNHFLSIYNSNLNKRIKGITDRAMEFLKDYQWPGNVRELENFIHRTVVLGEKHIISQFDLPSYIKHQSANEFENVEFINTLAELEKEHIVKVLKYVGGNRSVAAELLGIHRSGLYSKIQRYQI